MVVEKAGVCGGSSQRGSSRDSNLRDCGRGGCTVVEGVVHVAAGEEEELPKLDQLLLFFCCSMYNKVRTRANTTGLWWARTAVNL